MKKNLKESIKAKLRKKLLERKKLMKEEEERESFYASDIAQDIFNYLKKQHGQYEEIDEDLTDEITDWLDGYFIYDSDIEEMCRIYAEDEYNDAMSEALDKAKDAAWENAVSEVYDELSDLVEDYNDNVEEEPEEEVEKGSKNLKLKESARINMRRRILESRNSKRLNKSKLV